MFCDLLAQAPLDPAQCALLVQTFKLATLKVEAVGSAGARRGRSARRAEQRVDVIATATSLARGTVADGNAGAAVQELYKATPGSRRDNVEIGPG